MDRKGWFGAIFSAMIVIAVIGGIIITLFGLRGVGTAQGTHTGYITAIEHQSNIIWGADILYFKTDSQSSQEDVYCINNNLLDEARKFQQNRTLVTITFQNDFLMWAWDCNGGSTIITEIQE